jgi:protein TonB
MSGVQRSLSLGAISMIVFACAPKGYKPEPASAREADSIAVTADSTAPRYQFQVTKPALVIDAGVYPRYPANLNGVEGRVLVQFVVGTDGRAEMATFKVLRSTDDAFTAAVRAVIPLLRFTPAEASGKKVRQYVQMPFEFRVQH